MFRREERKGRRRVADVLFDGDWLIKNHQNQIGKSVARSGALGLPIFVDEALTHQKTLVMPGGTHRDAVDLDTHDWMSCESAQPVPQLGVPLQ